jgi:glyoxylase-like metal-dependent hydrolase (beta-lactamase superfamily II)
MRAAAILLSHGHPDHAPGASVLKPLLSIPVYASGAISSQVARDAGVDFAYAEGASFDLDNDRLEVIPAPGHTPDQVAFWMPVCRVLVTGDTILGEGSTLVAPPEGDMSAYMDTLSRFRALDPALILPGHGPLVRNPPAKIDEYVRHRLTRERQLVESLRRRPATIPELVSRLYAATDPRLHSLAEGSVAAQLQKLAREGRVVREGDMYRLCDP